MTGDNLLAPPGEDSLSVFREISTRAGPTPPWSRRLDGGLLEGVPLAAGLCPVDGCARWQGWFGLLYPVLLALAAALAVRAYRRAAGAPRGERVGPVVHLALVVGAALTMLSYVRSPLAATSPLDNARYLSVLQLSLPAVLWPLWVAAVACWRGTVGVLGRLAGALATAVLAALAATMLVVTVLFAATGAEASQVEERQARELADTLRAGGPREVYGDYWTCNRLIFNTAQAVVCGVLDGDLTPGQNRYRRTGGRWGGPTGPGTCWRPARRRNGGCAGCWATGPTPRWSPSRRVSRVPPQTPVRPWR